jgi:uncharacterized membrane protein (DUF373 family)
MKAPECKSEVTRTWIARVFTVFEDIVYVGLGLLLGASAIVLLVSGVVTFVQSLVAGTFPTTATSLLDRILLILLIVELLYTVQVSFRTHSLLPEPFLLVGLIAAIRRVLILTAEFGHGSEKTEAMFKNFFIELVILTVLILAIAISLVLVRKRPSLQGPGPES